jgi:hypothetical protein
MYRKRAVEEAGDRALPILVEYGQEALDWGVGAVPRVILRFYRHLESNGERLDDREVMPLVLILALWEDGERELRLSNLPSATPIRTLEERYLAKWRRMGLVFTRRVYYTYREMVEHYGGEENVPATPRLRGRVFDLSSLLYNCLRVARLWRQVYPAARARWEEAGEAGKLPSGPHPRIPPPDFRVEVELPLSVARRVVVRDGEEKGYQFVPEKWIAWAREAVPTRIVEVGDRTHEDCVGTASRTYANRVGQLEYSFPDGKEVTPDANASGGPPGGGPAGPALQIQPQARAERSAGPGIATGGEESLAKVTAAGIVEASRTPVGPADPMPEGRVTPDRPPAEPGLRVVSARCAEPGEGASYGASGADGSGAIGPPGASPVVPSASRVVGMGCVEPLPERRRRVLDDLRQARNRRQCVAIVTANVGEILGLGFGPGGRLRTRPVKGDYGRIGRMMREYGDEQTWVTACTVAGSGVEGDPLDYLEACLREQRAGRAGRREGSYGKDKRRGRDDYPTSPDGYGDGYEV